MAYYSGSVNSFNDLQTALVNGCVAEGWSYDDGILHKGPAFIRPYVSTTTTTTAGPGLIIQGGTGRSGGTLVDPSTAQPRLGRLGAHAFSEDPAWPAEYFLHIFDDPDEVYLILRFNVDRHYFLSFGVSSIPVGGAGIWMAGTTGRPYGTTGNSTWGSFRISPTGGGSGGGASNGQVYVSGPFWGHRDNTSHSYLQNAVHCDIGGVGWKGAGSVSTAMNEGAISAAAMLVPLVNRQPNGWNQEAVLLPIQPHLRVSGNKVSMLADLAHARYVRVDNYASGDIIQLGADLWRVYPFYLKDSGQPDGGGDTTSVATTGTFGWAIRYDGD